MEGDGGVDDGAIKTSTFTAENDALLFLGQSPGRRNATCTSGLGLKGCGKTHRRFHSEEPQATKNLVSRLFEKLQIFREVYPERSEWAQDDSEGLLRMTLAGRFSAAC